MFRRSNYVSQIDERDCGVAALCMIARYYGSSYSLAHLRELAKTDMQGTTALGIVKAAEKLGFETNAIKTDMAIFEEEKLPFPFIVHVIENNSIEHYMVVYKVNHNSIYVADPNPAKRFYKCSKKRFSEEWTGVIVFVAPGPRYHPAKEKSNSLLNFIPLLFKSSRLIVNIILAALLVTVINIVGSYYFQALIDIYIPDQLKTTLGIVSAGLIVAYCIQQLLTYARQYLLLVFGQRLSIDVLLSYIKHIYALPMSFFSTRRTGEITSRFSDANAIIDALASAIVTVFLDITTVLIVGLVMCIQCPALFALSLVAIPLYCILIFIFYRPFQKLNNDRMQANSIVSSSIIEDINGIETIKSLNGEKPRYRNIDHEFVKYLDRSFSYSKSEILQSVLKTGSQLLLNVAVLWFGSTLVMKNSISIGQLLTFNTLLSYFTNPLLNIINLQAKLQSAKVANTRLNEVFLIKAESKDDENVTKLSLCNKSITLKNISFKFDYGANILDNVSLEIKSGEKVAIVGMSGSGKTTLAKLLVSFFEPTEGTIYVGKTNINNINRMTLRRYISYLPQDPYIFSGTILDNLILGSHDGVTLEEIEKATEIAEIRKDIENMPLSYRTTLTSDSTIISGGQKQRIALARALLTNSPVLILDEATSNLDTATEKRIVNNLLSLKTKTIIFIVHRLSVAKRCDYIYLLENGKIMEEGTHSELISNHAKYYHLFQD